MLTLLLWALLAVVVVVVIFVLASNFLPAGEQIAPPLRDEPIWTLPQGTLVAGDEVDAVKLPVAVRGYRFAETDALLDLLAEQLRARDREIALLRGSGDFEARKLAPHSPESDASEDVVPVDDDPSRDI